MNKHRIIIVLCSALLLLISWTALTLAQVQGNQWLGPYRLSSEEGAYVDSSNGIVADQYGQTHLFWIENNLPDDRYIIQYTRFNGETWSVPVDIYSTLPEGVLDLLSATVDQRGLIHLVWTEGLAFRQYPVYYTRAPAHDALSAKQWSTPTRIDIPAHRIKVQVDSNDVIHLLYSKAHEPRPGVYYLRSEDQGTTWSEPLWLDPDILTDYAPASLQFVMDEADGLHAVWHYAAEDTAGDWVRYAHSLDGGQNWSIPITIDRDEEASGKLRAAGPLLTVQGQTVHIIWGSEVGSAILRFHRFSTDRGRTWSAARQVFGNLNGQAGEDLVTDGAGRVHFFGQIRYPQGMWHAYWDQDRWVGPSLMYLIARDSTDPIGDRIHAHSVQAAVRAGNQLVTTFYDRSDERPFALYAMYRTLDDIPPSQAEPMPTLKPTSTPRPSPTATQLPPTPTPSRRSFDASAVPAPAEVSGPANIFWLALIPTLLVIGGVIIAQLWQKR